MRKATKKLKDGFKKFKNQKGFTLIELMAVIAILAMIVLIAVPAVGSILQKAEDGSEAAHVSMIENAAELAYVGGDVPNAATEEGQFEYMVGSLASNGYLNIDEEVLAEQTDWTVKRDGTNGTFTLVEPVEGE